MANGLRSVLTSNNTGGTGTSSQSTFTLAGTEQVGDVAVMFFDQATGSNSITSVPSGATLQDGPDTSGTTARGYCYTKTLTSGDLAAGTIGPFTWNGSGRMAEGGIVLQGDTETGIVVGTTVVQSGATTSLTLPSVTSGGASWDIIAAVTTRVGSGTPPTVSFPAGYTSDVQSKLNTAAANVAMAVGHLTSVGAAGSYGGGNATYSSATPTIGWTLAVPQVASGFTGSASLSGSGTLSAGGSPAAAGSATLSGSGTLNATGSPATSGTATFSGSGTLNATGSPATSGSATLSGSGSLNATGTPSAPGTATLSGAGTLAAGGTPAIGQTAALSGSGTLVASGSTSANYTGSAALSGSGTLVAGGTPRPVGTATLSGSGTLNATGKPGPTGTAALSGSGQLVAGGTPRPVGAAVLSGSGTLVGGAVIAFAVAAALSGTGQLDAIGFPGGLAAPTPPERTSVLDLGGRTSTLTMPAAADWTSDSRVGVLDLSPRISTLELRSAP